MLMITTALVGITFAGPGQAAPVGTWVATAIFGAAAAGTASFAIVAGVVSMAASIGLSFIAQKLLMQKQAQETVRAELTRPTSLPAYRYVYGKTWAPGTPVAWTVRGRGLYICYLLNSRPSAGPFTVLFDKRPTTYVGDPYDFSGLGAQVNGPDDVWTDKGPGQYVRYWIGRGDQTTCPQRIITQTNGYFTASDAWRGRTVLWAEMDCGDDDERSERWPATPPEVNVDGNWSMVLDPRDGQQKFTRNQALIVLDALRRNPVRPYPDAYLRLDTFIWGGDVAAQAVATKTGGTIPRYTCDGILTFTDGTEIEDQIQPLLDAGAARLTRIGGKLAFVPAVTRPSVKTISDVTDGQPLELVRWRSSDEIYTEVVARFPAPDRAYESAETPVYVIPGAQAQDGGVAKRLTLDLDFVTDHRQAQRICKIMGWRSRMQRQVSAELFPDSFDLVAGSVATLALPAPYANWNRDYEVAAIEPAAGLNDDESVTIRLPVVLQETSAEITSWSAATEEQDMIMGDFDASRGRVQPPPKPAITTGSAAAQQSGDETVPGVIGAWTASPSASASGYLWQWRKGTGGWRAGGELDDTAADGSGVYTASIPWVEIGSVYQIRVQTIGTHGRSAWVVSDPVTAMGPVAAVATPPRPTATAASASRINLVLQQANDSAARALLLYGASTNNPLAANQIGTEFRAGASVTINTAETGLASGATRYYWTRARDQWGNLSDVSPSATATTS
ncbi:phage tail protein [Paracoccus yeei]|uniref:Tip attachment protein J domain-containing protein n=1 Tax=Paracoccus yeei TaxID=147645 RepID=A0A5P2QSK9_9RHOB|nr:phage tail protein [Paracoccus yeei]QEU09064.1 hypothetical protein FOB51_14240 [Paracoccus yeei]